MDRHCANRVVNSQVFEQIKAPDDDHSATDAYEEGSHRVYPVAGAGDSHQSTQEAVDRDAQGPLFRAEVRVKDGNCTCGTSRQCGVERYTTDALNIHCGQCAAGVKSVPTKP